MYNGNYKWVVDTKVIIIHLIDNSFENTSHLKF